MRRLRVAIPFAALLAGCPSQPPPPKPAPATTAPAAEPHFADGGEVAATPPPTPPPIVQPRPAAKQPKPGTRDLAGLKLEIKKDGTAHLTGKDRWGQKIDTTYESAAYLRDAIPVLKRSATDPQSAALDKLATELAPPK